ncbi:MAG: aminotransferase class IV [Eubacteriaceae bacterium]
MNTYYFHNGCLKKENIPTTTSIPENSVYEVLKIINGKPLFFEDHMIRFKKSINKTGNIFDMPEKEVLNEIVFLCDANKVFDTNIRVIYIPVENEEAFDFVVYFTDSFRKSSFEEQNGIKVETVQIERNNPNIKTIGESYNNKIQDKKKSNVFEFLLVNNDGEITEGSRSNVFFIKDNVIYTPHSKNILLGVTRKQILEICNSKDINITYHNIKLEEAYKMDAAFISSTSIGVVPIASINEKVYNTNNSIVKMLQDEYGELVEKYIKSFVLDI